MVDKWIDSGFINTDHVIEMEILVQKKKDIIKFLGNYKKINKNDDLINKLCPICNSNFECNEYKRVLPICHHIFHKKCIDKIIVNLCECPKCKTSIFPNNLNQ